jgi:hypothetical protein
MAKINHGERMNSIYWLKSHGYKVIALIGSLFCMIGSALADTSFSIDKYPGITNWNALALAVDPSSANSFVVSLSYGGEDNLYKFSPNGSLIYSKRVDLGTVGESFDPRDAVIVNNNIYIRVLEREPASNNLVGNVVRLNDSGDILSSFPVVNAEQRGLGYISSSNTFIAINYADRNNPAIVEFGAGGSIVNTFEVNDPYLLLPGGHTIGASYNPSNQSIFTSYLNQTGISGYDHALAEYKLGNDSQYYVANIYDLTSVGITGTVLAMDINRSNGELYVQEGNSRIVAFNPNELVPMPPVPEPEVWAMLLPGLALMLFMHGVRRQRTREIRESNAPITANGGGFTP